MKKFILCIAALSFMTGAYAQDNKLPVGPGEVEVIRLSKSQQIGVWNPKTKVYTMNAVYQEGPFAGQNKTLTFTSDGKVVDREGNEIGSKQADGSWKSARIENLQLFSYLVMWNNNLVGNVLPTLVSIHGESMIGTSAPMDSDVLTFLVFGYHYGGEGITKIAENIKKEKDRQAAEARRLQQEEAKNPKNTAATESPKKEVRMYEIENKSYSTVGYVDENGVVYDRSRWKIGQLPQGSGSILDKSGNAIGSISSGKVRNSRTGLEGDVESNGNIRLMLGGTNLVMAENTFGKITGAYELDKWSSKEFLGKCDCNNVYWTAALVFFDVFGIMK